MKFKAVGRVSMGNLRFKVRWQIDDVDSAKGAFLRADTASNTESLGDERDLGFTGDFNAETSTPHHRAGFLALLSAFLFGDA